MLSVTVGFILVNLSELFHHPLIHATHLCMTMFAVMTILFEATQLRGCTEMWWRQWPQMSTWSLLFCFSFYIKDTDSTKTSHEFELLQMQFKHGESIFSCTQWGLYGDLAAIVTPGVNTLLAHDVSDDFHSAKSKVQEHGSTLDCLHRSQSRLQQRATG